VFLRQCSVKQSTWGKYGDKKLVHSFNLFDRPVIFWWNTVKLFVLFEFDRVSLLAWGCYLKLLGPCFLHFRLSFCILRDLVTLIEPFIRELSPTLRSLFTIKSHQILLKSIPWSCRCSIYNFYLILWNC